ncbi:uncharacterized protein LOC129004311 [Macrosteles quadrilineatus]|uniref:uncharacterized protein LOC129004311 n=1 Tax=Macrosteles quadrilineatus TaxID=74068 RepID=UPI0023E0AA17|nr:uncharacterized protein LOC129004311 [Macrosteles quadrilineatus]
MVRVSVPQYPELGQDVELLCRFELQGDRLYSVSWYKDYMEFYRFVPRGTPTQHVHKMEGINVDLERSDAAKVVLLSVPLKASGLYMCEVSAEAPYFTSVHGQAWMSVVVLPQEGPRISGGKPHYSTGQDLSLNCTAGPSHPAPRLQWFLNGHQVKSESQAVTQRHQQLLSSSAELRLVLRPEHFHHGRLKVRCLASLPTPHHTLREANLVALRGVGSQQCLVSLWLLILAIAAASS